MKIRLLIVGVSYMTINLLSNANAAVTCNTANCNSLCPSSSISTCIMINTVDEYACTTYVDTCYQDSQNSSLKYKARNCTGCQLGYKLMEIAIDSCPGTKFKTCMPICDQGYYNDTSGICLQCPSSGGIHGTTAGTGATSITECYIPANTSLSDTGGTYTYTQDCHYSL